MYSTRINFRNIKKEKDNYAHKRKSTRFLCTETLVAANRPGGRIYSMCYTPAEPSLLFWTFPSVHSIIMKVKSSMAFSYAMHLSAEATCSRREDWLLQNARIWHIQCPSTHGTHCNIYRKLRSPTAYNRGRINSSRLLQLGIKQWPDTSSITMSGRGCLCSASAEFTVY